MLIDVMILHTVVVTIFVASMSPPRPASKIASSQPFWAKYQNANAVSCSKAVGVSPSRLAAASATAVTPFAYSLSLIQLPHAKYCSVLENTAGDVYLPSLIPASDKIEVS